LKVFLHNLHDAALRSIKAGPSHARGRKDSRRVEASFALRQFDALKVGSAMLSDLHQCGRRAFVLLFRARCNGSLLRSFGAFSEAHLQDALGRALSPAYRPVA
jgi:hypothetical protein